ncbi:Detected protein of unknown function [Hibiscus syriacus]|uniref:Uncharacterized protein n=1 Tax=Hibiscus syriacus TaxID=106335 RepID=A0A6A3D3S8_HIBSY|nr:uncharacterized protein LOC120136362 [Hibiscus syriacus]KAE8736126.1 Detected protein of unknown function [Hibiscus syriacus]
MFDLLVKPKFYSKCKSAIKMIKMRLETIKKKRNAVEKYLKNDIADLLMNCLDDNAYNRVEGLLMEQKRTSCYNFIEQFCDCIADYISFMQKQRECPEECREAVPSLIYAAARFADLPELFDLRTIFTEKYGNSLDLYLNQEFVQKLKVEPPTKEMKIQLMHNIAQEFSIEWDSKALEQSLFKPPLVEQNKAQQKSSYAAAAADKHNSYTSKKDTFEKSNNQNYKNGLSNVHENMRPKGNKTNFTSHGGMEYTDDKLKLNSSSEGEVTDQDIPKSSSLDGSVSEDGIENRKPFFYRFIPPPYVRPSLGKEKSITEEPMAPSDNTNVKNNNWNDSLGGSKPGPLKPQSCRKGLKGFGKDGAANISLKSKQTEEGDKRDEEEKKMDELLMHYSKKKSPYEWLSKWKTAFRAPPKIQESDNTSKGLAPPPRRQDSDNTSKGPGLQSTKSCPSALPAGIANFSKEAMSSIERAGRHTRASSYQPHMLAGHVHPKLPEYDDLASNLAALRRQ